MIWLPRAPDSAEPAALRVGAWDAETHRFVATSERKQAPIAAYVSSEFPYAVLVTGTVPKMLGGDLADHVVLKEVTFWPLTPAGRPLATVVVDKGALSATIRMNGADAVLTMHSAHGYGGPGKPDLYEARFTFSPAHGTTASLARSFPEAPLDLARPRAIITLPFHNGTETWSASGGWSFEGRELRSAANGKTKLPNATAFTATTPSIVASPRSDVVALVWPTHSCGDQCGGGMFTEGAHRIVLVRMATGESEKVAEGTGVGAVRFDPSGRMFVQRDRTAFEWTATGPGAPLPKGVVLVPPLVPEARVQCCGF
jgi:hypothetical protein